MDERASVLSDSGAANAADFAGAPLTAGYGALRDSAAWRDVSAQGRIVVRGDDRARLLHAMTTNDVQHLAPGQGCYAFFLNAQGRILADVNLLCFSDHLLLDTESETRSKVYEHLDRYIIADDVTLEDVSDQTAAISVQGPTAGAVLEALGLTVPAQPGTHATCGAVIVARLNTPGLTSFVLIAPAGSKETLMAQLAAAGVAEAQPQDARTVRIEHGRPRYGEEITERYLVQETGQLHAVHFSKGCYLGQEIVERIRSRAQIHRVLRRLEIEGAQPPAAGSKLKSGDTDAGEIASAAFSPSLGKTVALAYVRSQFAEPGTELSVQGTSGGTPARVTD
jgi:aminomethyltransferase